MQESICFSMDRKCDCGVMRSVRVEARIPVEAFVLLQQGHGTTMVVGVVGWLLELSDVSARFLFFFFLIFFTHVPDPLHLKQTAAGAVVFIYAFICLRRCKLNKTRKPSS